MEGDAGPIVGIVVVVCLFCGIISAVIASNKGLSGGGYFVVGFLLGIIGLVIAIFAQPAAAAHPGYAPQSSPPGWYTDPWDSSSLRWNDGWQWTHHVTAPHIDRAHTPTSTSLVNTEKPRPHPGG